MTLEELYYVSQIVAVVAIFGSLVAIYLQRRREKLLDQTDRNRNAAARLGGWYNKMRDDPEYARIIRVSGHHWQDMPDNAKFVAHLFWTSVFLDLSAAHAQAKHGLEVQDNFEAMLHSMVGALRMPGLQKWWEGNKFWMPSEFHVDVDALLAGPGFPAWHEIMPQWKATERDLAILIADEAARLPETARDVAAPKVNH